MYSDEQIARVVHEANAALQFIQEDPAPSPPWNAAPAWQRESAIEGVRRSRNGETPRQLHQSWCDEKYAAGWVYGQVKDPDRKTHPCLVPYDQLPPGQRDKDHLFTAIVLALSVQAVSG